MVNIKGGSAVLLVYYCGFYVFFASHYKRIRIHWPKCVSNRAGTNTSLSTNLLIIIIFSINQLIVLSTHCLDLYTVQHPNIFSV